MTDEIRFRFDGREYRAEPGMSLAAALTAAGIRVFREGPNGAPRGLFCGMGVCQDCLLEVDGQPNRRACMTTLKPGMELRRQAEHPRLAAPVGEPGGTAPPAGRVESPDVLVIGGGAGGLSAAIAAAESGADTLLVDERSVPGGQYFKQRARPGPALDRQQSAGLALLRRARASGARLLGETEVWGAFPGPVLHATRQDAPLLLRPRTLVVATGAQERPRLVPGWDLPGVMTGGAAQTLWRSYRTLPGRRIAVVGNGPLNLQVADELRRGGADIVVVAEAAAAPRTRPGTVAAMLAASPRLTVAGAALTLRLRRHGVPLRFRTLLREVRRHGDGLALDLEAPGGAVSTWTADTVCMSYGFQPQNEILRLLGAEFDYDPRQGQWICRRSAAGETGGRGIFAVGDCCGLGGAQAAMAEGRIAGLAAAAEALGRAARSDPAAARRLARHRRFQRALWTLFAAPVQEYTRIDPRTAVCRCEGLDRAAIDGPAAEAELDISGVKRATRAGMGRCQGRYCLPVLAPHVAGLRGSRADGPALPTPRVPVRPVTIAALHAAAEAAGDEPDGEAPGDA